MGRQPHQHTALCSPTRTCCQSRRAEYARPEQVDLAARTPGGGTTGHPRRIGDPAHCLLVSLSRSVILPQYSQGAHRRRSAASPVGMTAPCRTDRQSAQRCRASPPTTVPGTVPAPRIRPRAARLSQRASPKNRPGRNAPISAASEGLDLARRSGGTTMLELGAAARGISRLNAALACLAVLAGCGSVAGAAGTASAARSPGAVAGPASDAGAASQARTGSASSPPDGPPGRQHVMDYSADRGRADPGRSRLATASWWRSMRISESFHHASRRDKPSSDTARETIRKISFKPTSRRSSHLRSGRDRPGACRTLDRALQGLCPGGTSFRHSQVPAVRQSSSARSGCTLPSRPDRHTGSGAEGGSPRAQAPAPLPKPSERSGGLRLPGVPCRTSRVRCAHRIPRRHTPPGRR